MRCKVIGVSPFKGSPCLYRSLPASNLMRGFGKRIAGEHYHFANAKSQKWNSPDVARVQIGVPVNIRPAALVRCSWLQLSAAFRVLAICRSFCSPPAGCRTSRMSAG